MLPYLHCPLHSTQCTQQATTDQAGPSCSHISTGPYTQPSVHSKPPLTRLAPHAPISPLAPTLNPVYTASHHWPGWPLMLPYLHWPLHSTQCTQQVTTDQAGPSCSHISTGPYTQPSVHSKSPLTRLAPHDPISPLPPSLNPVYTASHHWPGTPLMIPYLHCPLHSTQCTQQVTTDQAGPAAGAASTSLRSCHWSSSEPGCHAGPWPLGCCHAARPSRARASALTLAPPWCLRYRRCFYFQSSRTQWHWVTSIIIVVRTELGKRRVQQGSHRINNTSSKYSSVNNDITTRWDELGVEGGQRGRWYWEIQTMFTHSSLRLEVKR